MNVDNLSENSTKIGIIWALVLLLAFTTILPAEESWLLINPEARYAALAGAATAIVNDVSALYYNPAGLANCNEFCAGANYGTLYSNSEIYFAGAVRNFKHRGSLGTGLYLYNIDLNINGNDLTASDFSYYHMYVSVGYGYHLTRKIALGVSVKYIYSNAPNYTSESSQSSNLGKGLACDLGIQITNLLPFLTIGRKAKSGLSLGVALCNLGPAIKYRNDITSYRSDLTQRLRIGSAWHLLSTDLFMAKICYDFIKEYSRSVYTDPLNRHLIGCAFSFFNRYFIHSGLEANENKHYHMSWGIAYDLDKFRIDYCRNESRKSNFFGVSYAI